MSRKDIANDEQDPELDLDELSEVSGGGGKSGDNSKKYMNITCRSCGKKYQASRVFGPDDIPVCPYCGTKYYGA